MEFPQADSQWRRSRDKTAGGNDWLLVQKRMPLRPARTSSHVKGTESLRHGFIQKSSYFNNSH